MKSKEMVSKKKVDAKEVISLAHATEAIDNMRGAVTIVYPMVCEP